MDDEILGYRSNGEPIHETKRGYIYTSACILCCKCNAVIRGMGGPQFGSTCVPCHEAKLKEKNT
jgi:hypothetical protein